jgi:hypothetical protein
MIGLTGRLLNQGMRERICRLHSSDCDYDYDQQTRPERDEPRGIPPPVHLA